MSGGERTPGGAEDEVDIILDDEFRDSSPSELANAFAEARAFDGTEDDRSSIVVELRMRARAGVRFWGDARPSTPPSKPAVERMGRKVALKTAAAEPGASSPKRKPTGAPDLFSDSKPPAGPA